MRRALLTASGAGGTSYTISFAPTTSTNLGVNNTSAIRGLLDKPATLNAVTVVVKVAGSGSITPVVYSDTGALLSSESATSGTWTGGQSVTIPLVYPVALTTGTTYRIGAYAGVQLAIGAAGGGSVTSTPSGLTWTNSHIYYITGNAFPTTASATYDLSCTLALTA